MSDPRFCEYCHRKAVASARVLGDDGEWLFSEPVPLCRRCARDAEAGQSFSGCEREWKKREAMMDESVGFVLICRRYGNLQSVTTRQSSASTFREVLREATRLNERDRERGYVWSVVMVAADEYDPYRD